ncbi:MAG: serine/threonine-protein kinase [Myxococcales bacterium]
MPVVTCSQCRVAFEQALPASEEEVRCPECQLAAEQDDGPALELDWGDREPRASNGSPAFVPPGIATPGVAPPGTTSPGVASSPPQPPSILTAAFESQSSLPAELGAQTAPFLLGAGLLGELVAAGFAGLDVLAGFSLQAQYLPGAKRVVLAGAALGALALWTRLRTGPLTSLPTAIKAVALATLGGWLAWSGYVLVLRPLPSSGGFALEFLLCLLGAAGYALPLRLVLRTHRDEELAPATAADLPAVVSHAAVAAPPLPPVPFTLPATPPAGPESTGPESCPSCGKSETTPRCTQCGTSRRVRGARIMSLLSAKPHARTYLAQAAEGDRFVLKEMAFALAPDDSALAAFAREAELLAQLSHPAIPRLRASFQEGSGAETRFYLALEYIEGTPLEAELQRHRYTELEVVEVLRQVLGVLEYLHGLSPPILHRDIKPANILRRADGGLSLVDFGTAREGSQISATLVGTFGYMPPEQLAGQVDETSDLYALGMTALHLLTRQVPWEIFRDDPGAFPAHLAVSPRLRRFLQRLVAPRRAKRFASASQALHALEHVARGGSSRPLWWALAGGLAASAVGAGGLWLSGHWAQLWPQVQGLAVQLASPRAAAPKRPALDLEMYPRSTPSLRVGGVVDQADGTLYQLKMESADAYALVCAFFEKKLVGERGWKLVSLGRYAEGKMSVDLTYHVFRAEDGPADPGRPAGMVIVEESPRGSAEIFVWRYLPRSPATR